MRAGDVAVYARVSTDEQAEHGTSLDAQLAECRSHALRIGAAGVVPYVDAGISGTLLARPALDRLRADAAMGRIALVLCYDPDRLSRNLGHLLLLVDEFRRLGADVEFTNFAMSQSADGRLLFAMRGAIAEFETHKIRQRMLAGKLARAREGRPVGGGHTIYGYAYDRARARFVPDPAEAPVVAHIFRLAEDEGTHRVAAHLNAAGVPAKHGGMWSQTSVYGILRNRTYLGRMPQMGGVGHIELPPLVPEAVFDRVQATLTGRRNRPPGPARHPYLLSGRLRCGVCGRHMIGGSGQRLASGRYRRRYACSGKRSPGTCASAYYAADLVDAAIWHHVQGLLLAADVASVSGGLVPVATTTAPSAQSPPAVAIEHQRDRLLAAYRNGLLDAAQLGVQLRGLDAARRVVAAAPATPAQTGTAALVAAVLRAGAAAQAVEDRRFVLAGLDLSVVLGPGAMAVLSVAT